MVDLLHLLRMSLIILQLHQQEMQLILVICKVTIYQNACISSQVSGIFGGGNPTTLNTIEYVTISSTGNAQDFGDLTTKLRSAGFFKFNSWFMGWR